ncbi:MAG: hypothetical protein K9I34_07510, partial [Bacteroidales bacterium]|nr:hypothetical protein [Bacteroidales bacterium]
MARLLIILLILFFFQPSFSQDTIKVQTFTFDSISTRRAIFAFPDSSESFRKILMSYTLKCDAATTADQYDCGEWDYLTYTTVHHKTGEIDSILFTHDKFLAGISSFTEFPVCLTYPTYSLHHTTDTMLVIDSVLSETRYTGLFPQTLPIELNQILANQPVKLSLLFDDSMAQSMGIAPATPLTGLKLFFNNTNLVFHELQIRATTGNSGNPFYTSSNEFETYFNYPTHIQSPGWVLFPFGPQQDTLIYNYNQGGLRIEFSFKLAYGSQFPIILSAASLTGTPSIQAFSGNERCLEFSGSNWIELPKNPLSDSLSTEISISFWQFGDETMPQNSTLLNASNQSGNRVLNIHLPWGNSNVYWDAGLNGTSYDRINKLANAEDFKGKWNHWVFTKNAPTGSMKIYLNGQLWHSGTGKTYQMAGITSFNIGSSTSKSGFYTGKLDELSIWNRELTQAEIQELMLHKPNQLSSLTGLLAYYSFDDTDEAFSFSEYTSPTQDAMNFGGVKQRALPAYELRMNPQTLPFFPDLQFVQGEYESHQEIAVRIDTLWNSPVSIFEFETDQQSFVPVDTAWYYPGGIMIISNENGDSIGQIIHPIDTIIQQESIFYYGNPFDVVRNIEIGRFITPYGIGLSLGNNGFEWTYDVTDYASFLRDSVDLSAGNNQELIDLKFYMIQGTPPREVKEITEIWGSRNSYSYFDLDHNNRLAAQTIHLHPEASNFKLKTRLTGHGHNSNDGNYPHCCEWKPNEHYLLINEDTVANWHIWQNEKCAQNPVYPQGGTWPGSREGWCPGDKVNDHEFELTPYITSDSVKIEYDITDIPADNTGMGGGNYVISM